MRWDLNEYPTSLLSHWVNASTAYRQRVKGRFDLSRGSHPKTTENAPRPSLAGNLGQAMEMLLGDQDVPHDLPQ